MNIDFSNKDFEILKKAIIKGLLKHFFHTGADRPTGFKVLTEDVIESLFEEPHVVDAIENIIRDNG